MKRFYKIQIFKNGKENNPFNRTYYQVPLENKTNTFLDRGEDGLVKISSPEHISLIFDSGGNFTYEEMKETERDELIKRYGIDRLFR